MDLVRNAPRYNALDSWRGICACMVALFHFDVFSNLYFSPIIRNSYLFVDFFFVLSGFVIAANYRARLAEGFSVNRFLVLRLGRIYPLHLLTLLLFIPIDAVKNGVDSNLLQAIITNVFLLQGLGVNPQNWLNFVSWSISAEVAAYLVFSVVVARFGAILWPWLLLIVAGPMIIATLSPHGMDTTYDYGLVRCLYGFSLGVLCFDIRERFPLLKERLSRAADTMLEVIGLVMAVVYVVVAGDSLLLSVVSPLIFAFVVLVFAREGGAVSGVLTVRFMLLIGTLTYSIYMMHPFIRAIVRVALMALERVTDTKLFMSYSLTPTHEPINIVYLYGSPWLGDLLQILMLLLTVALSLVTYRFIEEPGRRWARRMADHKANSAQATFETEASVKP